MPSDDKKEAALSKLTVRELRVKAVKSLGAKASKLKTKAELVEALSEAASGASAKPAKASPPRAKASAEPKKATAAPAKAEKPIAAVKVLTPVKGTPAVSKAAAAVKEPAAPAKPGPIPRVATPVKGTAAVAKAATPAKGSAAVAQATAPAKITKFPAKKAASRPRVAKKQPTAGAAAIPSPRESVPTKPKTAVVAALGELPIARDFFIDPRKPSLPTSYGDDRLLTFRREPLAVVVSWDLSAVTFGDGQGLQLEVVAAGGRLIASAEVPTTTGLATFDALPMGKPLFVQVVRRGRVMTRGRPFTLGAVSDDAEHYQMTVPLDQPLPEVPEKRVWPEAPVAAERVRVRRASPTRLSS